MIQINFSIDDTGEFQTGELSTGAVRIKTPRTTDEMMKKASPIAVLSCFFMTAAMFIKTVSAREVVFSPVSLIAGFLLGFCLIFVHELLHAAVYPEEAIVTVGKLKGKLTFVALASYPLKRSRFIIMCLVPFILGLIPLAVFIISPAEFRVLNGLMFGAACIGMVSPFPDVYNVITVLRSAEKNDKIMFYKDEMYKVR